MYNTTNITDANNLYEIANSVNILSNGLFAGMILLVLFLLVLILTKSNYSIIQSMMGASFVCSVVGIMMFWLGFIGWTILILPIILFFAMIILNLFVS